MEKNKTGKYLKYAIGEIILVVIGILLALQINEWNNERNRKIAEAIVVEQLKADLKKTIIELEEVKMSMDESARASAIVCHTFWKKGTPHDSIYKYLRRPRGTTVVSPTLGTAKSLVNSGNITLLKSNTLKNDITAYVEEVDDLLKDLSRYEETYYRNAQLFLSETNHISNLLSQEDIKKRLESDDFATAETTRSDKYLPVPNRIEKIAFNTDLKQLFQNHKVYIAYNYFLIAHKRSVDRYDDMLKITITLLDKLEEINN
jgi:hypothetical protein